MTVSELIEKLSAIDPALDVCSEVDGGATRTGDYLDTDDLNLVKVFPVSYGGYEAAECGYGNDEDKANIKTVVVIR